MTTSVINKPCRMPCILIISALAISGVQPLSAAKGTGQHRIGVVYQTAPPPYNEILNNIRGGIDEGYPGQALHLNLSETDQELQSWIAGSGIDTVIALGTATVERCLAVPDLKVIAGAVPMLPPASETTLAGAVVMVPSPHRVVRELHSIAPGITRLHVVYWPPTGNWLIPYMESPDSSLGIEISVHPVNSLAESLTTYTNIVENGEARNAAFWLQHDPVTVDNNVLTVLLKHSWDRRIALVSSRIGHVTRGALLGLYPDPVPMGHQIGALAHRLQNNPDLPPVFQPVYDTKVAIHTITAHHMNLSLPNSMDRFDLVFPIK